MKKIILILMFAISLIPLVYAAGGFNASTTYTWTLQYEQNFSSAPNSDWVEFGNGAWQGSGGELIEGGGGTETFSFIKETGYPANCSAACNITFDLEISNTWDMCQVGVIGSNNYTAGWYYVPTDESSASGNYILLRNDADSFHVWEDDMVQLGANIPGKGTAHRYTMLLNGTDFTLIQDNIWIINTTHTTANINANTFFIGAARDSSGTCHVDNLTISKGILAPPDSAPPVLSSYNMTSQGGCTAWNTNPSTICETSDTTPTVAFNTNENAWCAISNNNQNYTTMGSSRNCTGGEGANSHTCTSSYELDSTVNYIYISCKDSYNNQNKTSSSGPLRIKIYATETEGDTAISNGIDDSISATKYANQQIYARNLNNNQNRGKFDYFASYLSQRWALNYVTITDTTSDFTNMFNITPVLYVMEIENKTAAEIRNGISGFINGTLQ